LRLLTHFPSANAVISEPNSGSFPSSSNILVASGSHTMSVLRFDLSAVSEPRARLLKSQLEATLKLYVSYASNIDTRCLLHIYPGDVPPTSPIKNNNNNQSNGNGDHILSGGWDEIKWDDAQLLWEHRPLH